MSGDASVTATFALLPPPGQPDLVEVSVSNPPATVRRKASFSATDTVRNQGTGGAAASTTRYYLSVDTVRSSDDRLLGGSRAVPALAAGAQSTGTASVKVGNAVPVGSYFLLACADATDVVAETTDANNCVASATKVTVTK
jgi:subtilase family serine protease